MLHHKKQLKHGIQTQNYLIPTKQPGLFSASSDPVSDYLTSFGR
jgi:hypothetical protein